MSTLTKADLSKRLNEEIGLTNREAKEIVELFYKEIIHALENGQQVKLSGFGNFVLKDKSERPGRNPRTGEEVAVSARRVVTFHCGQKLKSRVEQYSGKEMQQEQSHGDDQGQGHGHDQGQSSE